MARRKKNVAEQYESAFAHTLRKLMEEKSVTQDVLARAVGRTRQTVSQYVNGVSEPPYETLSKIAEYFDVSIDYLLGRTRVKRMDSIYDKTCISGKNIEALQLVSKGLQSNCDEWILYLRKKGVLFAADMLVEYAYDRNAAEEVSRRMAAREAESIARTYREIINSLIEAVFAIRDVHDNFSPIINPDCRPAESVFDSLPDMNEQEYLRYKLFKFASSISNYIEWKYGDYINLFECNETTNDLSDE